MKRFIKISAISCREDGKTGTPQIKKELYLNIDLIGAIDEQNIYPKDGVILSVNGAFFKDLKLIEKINLQDL